MKKIYFKPSTVMVTIKNENLLAVSLTETEAAKNATALSREERNSSWEDEEE